MKFPENFSVLSEQIEQYINEQQWQRQVKNSAFRTSFSLHLNPEKLFMGYFNRLIVVDKSYTFSRVIDPRINDKIDDAVRYFGCFAEMSASMTEHFDKDLVIEKPKSSPIDSEQWMSILNYFFGPAYLAESDINSQYLDSLADWEKQDMIMRWVETREDMLIIHTYSCMDQEIQITCSKMTIGAEGYEKHNWNPVTGYFGSLFVYESEVYEEFCNHHEIAFAERQGYPRYPQAELNEQIFTIRFNRFSEKSREDLYNSSFWSFHRMFYAIVSFIHLAMGADVNGNMEAYLENIDINIPNSKRIKSWMSRNTFVKGELHYFNPQNDIYIKYGPKILKNDADEEILICELKIRVVPSDNKTWDERHWYLHPIIYDTDK
jgi:hypothetical protein